MRSRVRWASRADAAITAWVVRTVMAVPRLLIQRGVWGWDLTGLKIQEESPARRRV
jgi:hypothetical protein